MKHSFLHFFILFILAGFFPQGADCALVIIKGEEAASTFENNTGDLYSARHIKIKGKIPRESFREVIGYLKNTQTLEHLELIENKLDSTQKAPLTDYLKMSRLKSLKIKDAAIDTSILEALEESFQGLSPITSTIISLSLVQKVIELTTAVTSKKNIKIIANILIKNKTLTSLDLSGNTITPEEEETFYNALKEVKTLTFLRLRNCGMNPESAGFLWCFLQNNPSITSLDLEGNELGDIGMSKYLIHALKQNSTLTELGLRNIKLSSEGVKALAGILKLNSSLRKLDLGSNKIDYDAMSELEEALKENKTLEELVLRDNHLTSDILTPLANALRLNSTLEKLDLGYNDLGNEGMELLAGALKFSPIKFLNISNNSILPQGAKHLADALKFSPMTHLIAGNNVMGDAGMDYIGKALRQNRSLIYFNVSENAMTSTSVKSLGEDLRHNSTLKELILGGRSLSLLRAQDLKNLFNLSFLHYLKKDDYVLELKDKRRGAYLFILWTNFTSGLFSNFKSIGKKIYLWNPYHWFRWKA